MREKSQTNQAVIQRVTFVGGVFDGLLGLLKISVGWLGQSQALVADGVHSLSDLASDVLVIVAARQAAEAPDENHPYGHERIQTIATSILAASLLVVAAGFLVDGVGRVLNPEKLQQPGLIVLIAAVVSTLVKELIYHYTMRAAEQIDSSLLRANAWHSRSDALSSVLVVIGVLGTWAGFIYSDALAAIAVAVMVGKVGWEIGRESLYELIDTSIDADLLKSMRETILSVEGVVDSHQVRARKMAEKVVMDAHINVGSQITVSEGHRIGDAVERALRQKFDSLGDLTVHIDPEDDDRIRLSYHLPLRSEIIERINQALQTSEKTRHLRDQDFDRINLHYLNGSIDVEMVLLDANPDPHLNEEIVSAVKSIEDIGKVSVLCKLR